jgi:hypothetical protein
MIDPGSSMFLPSPSPVSPSIRPGDARRPPNTLFFVLQKGHPSPSALIPPKFSATPPPDPATKVSGETFPPDLWTQDHAPERKRESADGDFVP